MCTTARVPARVAAACVPVRIAVCMAVCVPARIAAYTSLIVSGVSAKGEGIDDLIVWCPGGPTLPLDPGRGVFDPVTQWAQPAGDSETLKTLSRTEVNPFGKSMVDNGLRPEDGSRCPSGNRGGGVFKKTQGLSLSTHEN